MPSTPKIYLVRWTGQYKNGNHIFDDKTWISVGWPKMEGSTLVFTDDGNHLVRCPAAFAIVEELKQ